jgi:hypothetical protein
MTPRRRVVAAAVACVLVGVALQIVSTSPAFATCGVRRWAVKTLSDPLGRTAHFAALRKSLLRLRRFTPPTSLSSTTPRLHGVERQIYDVRAQVVEASGTKPRAPPVRPILETS